MTSSTPTDPSADARRRSMDVAGTLQSLPVTRLVHFTPAMNLYSILRDGEIRPSNELEDADEPSFTPTDEQRIDRHPERICCSFEYPNAYYQSQAQQRSTFQNYPSWVSLILDVDLALRNGTLFYPCNAATEAGRHGGSTSQHLLDMWASPSIPKGRWTRKPHHHSAVPTDLQAEVQIPGTVPTSKIRAIVTESPERCHDLHGELQANGMRPEQFEWRYAPMFYNKGALATAIHNGAVPPEHVWVGQ